MHFIVNILYDTFIMHCNKQNDLLNTKEQQYFNN